MCVNRFGLGMQLVGIGAVTMQENYKLRLQLLLPFICSTVLLGVIYPHPTHRHNTCPKVFSSVFSNTYRRARVLITVTQLNVFVTPSGSAEAAVPSRSISVPAQHTAHRAAPTPGSNLVQLQLCCVWNALCLLLKVCLQGTLALPVPLR